MRREGRYRQICDMLLSHGGMTSYQIASALGLTVSYTVFILERMMLEGMIEREKSVMKGAVGYKYVYYVPLSRRVRINNNKHK